MDLKTVNKIKTINQTTIFEKKSQILLAKYFHNARKQSHKVKNNSRSKKHFLLALRTYSKKQCNRITQDNNCKFKRKIAHKFKNFYAPMKKRNILTKNRNDNN